MSEFFARISGQFTGALLMAAFFPVLLFLTAFTLVLLPLTPYGHTFVEAVKDPAVWQKSPFVALLLTVVVLVLSVVLYSMNVPIVRLYEGYPWKESWVAKPFLARQRRRFERMRQTRDRLRALRLQMRLAGLKQLLIQAGRVQGTLARALNREYPDQLDSVLPTRLGNVIRAFETYTTRQYGVAIINLWPRLQPLVSPNVAQALEGSKTSFDFMLHSAFLSAALAVLTAAAGLNWHTHAFADLWSLWLAWAVLFAVVSYLLYLAAISRAVEWGTQVKVAFDLHRLELLKKLGFEVEPANLSEERGIWDIVNYRFAFPDQRTHPDLPYNVQQTSIIVNPVSTLLDVARFVEVDETFVEVTLVVTNIDPMAYDADQIVIREKVPSGYKYKPDTATVDGRPARLLSFDPLELDLGPLAARRRRTIVYCLTSPK